MDKRDARHILRCQAEIVPVRRRTRGDGADEDARIAALEAHVRFQTFLLKRMAHAMRALAGTVTEMNAARELLEDEMVRHAAEDECRFEAVFEELDLLRRDGGFGRMGDAPAV